MRPRRLCASGRTVATRRMMGGWLARAVSLAGILVALGAGSAEAVPKRFWGMVPQLPLTGGDFFQMEQAKVGTLRFLVHWPTIQPTKSVPPNWNRVDQIVTGASQQGIKLLPFIYGSPPWVANESHKPPLGSAADRNAWKKFLRQAVGRYGPGGEFWELHTLLPNNPIEDWQLWNEQNAKHAYKPKPSVKGYGKLVKISHAAITGVDPGARIVLGGMFGTPKSRTAINAWTFLERLYDQVRGIKRKFDDIALHPYSPTISGIKAQIKLMRKAMRSGHDRGADIRITELGWGSANGGHVLNKGEQGQKRMLRKSFDLLRDHRRSWDIEGVFWFTWKDPPNDNNALCEFCQSAGLLKPGGAQKPAWNAYTSFTGGDP
jgi:hypothetical protein